MQTLGILLETELHSTKRLPTFLPLLQQCLREHRDSCGRGPSERELDVDRGEVGDGDGGGEGGSGGEGSDGEEDEGDGKEPRGEAEEDREEDGMISNGGDVAEEDRLKESDRLLFSTLSTLGTMCRECDLIGRSTGGGSGSLPVDMNSIWGE